MINGGFVSAGKKEMRTMSKSPTTTDDRSELLDLIPPGEILLEEFLRPLGMSQYRLARELRVPPRRINEIVHGTRSITADTALRLARFFGTSAQFWLNLQTEFDVRRAKRGLGDTIEREIEPLTRPA
jgi:addiction module HigA family antidote